MADVKWIKIATDIFDDEKILLIESLPEADTIITVWFKLLCLAGKQNNSGVFILNDKIPYTDKMLATIFRRKETSVQLALKTFQEFGMIEIVDNVITIPNWSKHQNLDQLEERKDYMKNYMKSYRNKQKGLVENVGEKASKVNSKTNSKVNSKANVSALDIDKEEDKDKDKETNINISNNIVPSDANLPSEFQVSAIFNLWNECKITVHKEFTEEMLKAINKAINLYGIDKITEGIKHYYIVYKDAKYFFNYKWKLVEFLKQANALPAFFDNGDKWVNYQNSKSGKKATEQDLLNGLNKEEILNDFRGTR